MKKLIIIAFLTVSTFAIGQIKVGDKLPALSLNDSYGKTVKLNETNNKWILVDFWASWCAPCRMANKKLVKLYQNTSRSTFEIVGISIDTDAKKWQKAIIKDNLKHIQLIDPMGFDAKSAVTFGVEQLPSSFLFNPKGVLVAIDPTEKEILNYIKK